MRKRISIKAICPYYKHENTSVVYCEGLNGNMTIHAAFDNRGAALEYKNERCRSRYKECGIYQLLEEKTTE